MIQIHNIQITITGDLRVGYEATLTKPKLESEVEGVGLTEIEAIRDLFDNIWSKVKPTYFNPSGTL